MKQSCLYRVMLVALVTLMGMLTQERADAYTMTFTGKGINSESGNTLVAQAKFDYDGGSKLLVTLTNLSPNSALTTSDVLTAIYFSMGGGDEAKPLFAQMGEASKLLNGDPKAILGKEWDYERNLVGPKGATSGIGASQLGSFEKGNFDSNGNNVEDYQYGIVNGVGEKAKGDLLKATLVSNSMLFAFEVNSGFDYKSLGQVSFKFGSNNDDPLLQGILTSSAGSAVPEPGSIALLGGLGSTLLVPALRRRRNRRLA